MTDFAKDSFSEERLPDPLFEQTSDYTKFGTAAMQLPAGYALKLDQHGMGWHVYEHGLAIRRQKKTSSDAPSPPVWFREKASAIEYARKHAREGEIS